MNHTSRKRQRRDGTFLQNTNYAEDQLPWSNDSRPYDYSTLQNARETQDIDTSPEKNKKRAYESDADNDSIEWAHPQDIWNWAASYLEASDPSLPSMEDRPAQVEISNPFLDVAANRHSFMPEKIQVSKEDALGGYIRFTSKPSQTGVAESSRQKPFRCQTPPARRSARQAQLPQGVGEHSISRLPPNFDGLGIVDTEDTILLNFYTRAFCSGRTLLESANFWLKEITPMAAQDPCVKHAVLAFAGNYVVEYLPNDKYLSKANAHYKKATHLLSVALSDSRNLDIDKANSLVAAFILLSSEDVVQWELRRPRNRIPRWREGAEAAKKILDISDPGYRYWKNENVQSSRARVAYANRIAFIEILALLVTPLKVVEGNRLYQWLLEGTKEQARKIHDATGLSPKLLHYFAEITNFAALMIENPNAPVLPQAAQEIEKRLQQLKQSSDLSEGYQSTENLFESCIPDTHGKVNNTAQVTDLTGEAWLATAKIYLHCRFFRKPRSHPDVLHCLDVLRRCVELMPSSGPLFTSQSPFCPIFILGLVSNREEDRKVVRDWFETQCAPTKPRSSVPPVWKALQSLWKWMDTELEVPLHDDSTPIGSRSNWWEFLVAHIMDNYGQLSLC